MSATLASAPATPVPVVAVSPPRASGFGTIDLLLLLMAARWGANFFAVRYRTAHMPGLAFNGSRMLLGAAVMLVTSELFVREPWPSRGDTLRLLAQGVIGNGIYQFFFVQGPSRSRGGFASLIFAVSPAALTILGWATKSEKMNRFLVGGVVLSVIGVAMVMVGDNTAAGHGGTWPGSMQLACAVVTRAIYATLLRPLTHRVNRLQLTLITLAGGLGPLLMFTTGDLLATHGIGSIGVG